MLYEPIRIGERMPTKSTVKVFNSARGVKYWVLPYNAGMMSSMSFAAFYQWFESENICNSGDNTIKNDEAGRLYDMLVTGTSARWRN